MDLYCQIKQVMSEPLVDIVDQKLYSKASDVRASCRHCKPEADCYELPIAQDDGHIKDTSFTAPFKLVAERDDYIHALVAYFDVSFTKCHKLIGFSTGPKSRATHWKQTVLYLENVLTVCQGEAVKGTMTVTPNKKNPRDVDITLKYSLNGRHCQASRTQFYRMR